MQRWLPAIRGLSAVLVRSDLSIDVRAGGFLSVGDIVVVCV